MITIKMPQSKSRRSRARRSKRVSKRRPTLHRRFRAAASSSSGAAATLPLNVRFNAELLQNKRRLAFQMDFDQVDNSKTEFIIKTLTSEPYNFKHVEGEYGIIFTKIDWVFELLEENGQDDFAVGKILGIPCSTKSFEARDRIGYANVQYLVRDVQSNKIEPEAFFRQNCHEDEIKKEEIVKDLTRFALDGYDLACRINYHGAEDMLFVFYDGELVYIEPEGEELH